MGTKPSLVLSMVAIRKSFSFETPDYMYRIHIKSFSDHDAPMTTISILTHIIVCIKQHLVLLGHVAPLPDDEEYYSRMLIECI